MAVSPQFVDELIVEERWKDRYDRDQVYKLADIDSPLRLILIMIWRA
ncbi:hypothetical protein N474_08165 [Pseudoalteromonas luteoviolacea CPMOR-2]|uniref:Uncharacterized protein n=1 Tax=Pseudoalteromonas luteoviolacea DSM 6061 TaxID=1365250 RepID=A0A166YUG6_9GAMM|nr:hypothetical protein N475_09020 [Pseudoalteromonas luteoviolacea DSM 6061]KZN57375.1 hypothetical protein N474_08165 [Pseudoalteromonas luteoviolacea CPMOR-2]MBE0388032.1 hypothetical protein [Pseudoalteromonas luteoviolacea DSM 6061]